MFLGQCYICRVKTIGCVGRTLTVFRFSVMKVCYNYAMLPKTDVLSTDRLYIYVTDRLHNHKK